jgi:hypothetical protein
MQVSGFGRHSIHGSSIKLVTLPEYKPIRVKTILEKPKQAKLKLDKSPQLEQRSRFLGSPQASISMQGPTEDAIASLQRAIKEDRRTASVLRAA